MIRCRRSSTSSAVHLRRMLFCVISRPEVATPPALLALPGLYNIFAPWKSAIASGVLGMLAPSVTQKHPFFSRFSASAFSISFCVAHGMAMSQGILHGRSPAKYCACGYLDTYSLIRPRRTFFSSITYAIFSSFKPSGSYTKPSLSLSVSTFAPRRIAFCAANCATLPAPEIQTRLPSKD